MPIRNDCISRPVTPVSRTFVPEGSTAYHVQDGDSWDELATRVGIDVWRLLRYNYPTLPIDKHAAAREVNWYLQEYVGCRVLTSDNKNYKFSASAIPGIVYLPKAHPDVGQVPVLDN